jgi:predicted Rossmann-fold nucleotide-binding protein
VGAEVSADRYLVLVCGGRDFKDFKTVARVLAQCLPHRPTHVLTGGCRGADKLAQQWALIADIPSSTYAADWDRYGKSAGPRRNQAMLDDCHPDLVVAFPGGRGTADMVRRAKIEGVPVFEWTPLV